MKEFIVLDWENRAESPVILRVSEIVSVEEYIWDSEHEGSKITLKTGTTVFSKTGVEDVARAIDLEFGGFVRA